MAEVENTAKATDMWAADASAKFEFVRDGVGVKNDWGTGPDKVRKAVGEA